MKRALILCLIAWAACAARLNAADNQASDNPTAGGIAISPQGGAIAHGDVITITFPNSMVAPNRIDLGNQPCPFVSTPKLDGTFLWKSETEGDFTVNTVVAGATHRLTLAPGLKDAAGRPVSAPDWNADYTTQTFSLSTDAGFRSHLSARPFTSVSSTYDVRLEDVARHAWVQDRDSRAHFPVEVVQTTDGPPEAAEFQVAPRDPLPPNHTYDLVIQDLPDSKSHQPLPYPAVLPLGDTHDLKIDWLGAFNHALDEPTIRIKFNDAIPPDSLKPGMVEITPEVQNLEIVANEDEVDLTGDFDLAQRYHVTVSKALVGERGYPLPADSRWAASFSAREPALSFPGPRIFLRSRSSLHFAFLESHTPAVTWKLATVPLEKLPAITERLAEYQNTEKDPLTGEDEIDPKTGDQREKQTELLVDACKLPVVLTGSCEASSADADTLREVNAPLPAGASLSGPYLIEASSTLPDGRVAGGRALVFFSDYLLTQQRSPTQLFLRVAKMSDALPAAGVTVRALRDDSIELARAVTGSNGIAVFSNAALFPDKKPNVNFFVAYPPGGPCIGFADGSTYDYSAGSAPPPTANHAIIVTDRNLYRPGEEVKMKGMLRDVAPGGLAVPPPGDVQWQVLQGDGGKVIGTGTATLSEQGGFEASWQIPPKAALGQCTLKCLLSGSAYDGASSIDVEEYRVPLFSVDVSAETETGTTAHAQVSSEFFHGGANSGARVHWEAEWDAMAETGSDTVRYNAFPAIGPVIDSDHPPAQTISGDAKLDAQGQLALACDSPFKANAAVAHSQIRWHADITSIDGQAISGGTNESFSSSPVLLGVAAEEKATGPRGISVRMDAVDADGNPVSQPVNATADLYHVTTRTVKEQVAPMVFKYHNNDEFTKIDSRDTTAPGSLVFSATETGRYVVALHARGIPSPIVSTETTVTGEEPAEMPVQNETSFSLSTRQKPWAPGDTAVFTVQAPFAGVAWVSIETNDLLDTMVVPLPGNAARIEIPVKKEYAPNATVSVYLTRPGGSSGLPAERFAAAPLTVNRPDRELHLAPHLDHAKARPGDPIHGEVTVTSEGKPVAGADLAIFVVNDAILQLGGWTLPDLLSTFYPQNPFGFVCYQTLTDYIEQINPKGSFEKGFVIGDGGEEAQPNMANLRKEFRTLAFWQGSLKTGADGKAQFDFKAPDNLTAYRLIAIGQTKESQFGGDASQTVEISKPLLIDTALPRFLRDGDEIELRAVVRQSFADSAPVTARCVTDGGCALTGESVLTGTASRNSPVVLRFKAKVNDPDLKPLKVRFEASAASDPSMSDAVEVSIPVSPPTIVRHETVAGSYSGAKFDAADWMPKDWTRASGQFSLTASTSEWLPALAGIPAVLDYPHGCFEQITSKLLCCSLLTNLMDYLPGTEARLGDYHAVLQQAVDQIGSSLLPDGRLPYWPGQTVGNDFVTCQACWALNEAAHAGFEIPEDLAGKLSTAAKAIASGNDDLDTRAFALFVLASLKSADNYGDLAEDIYLHRNNMGPDGRALLAMALHQLDIMPTEKLQLMAELDKAIAPAAFNPATFSSMNRTEGMTAMAFETIAPPNFTAAKKAEIRKRLLGLLGSASDLSMEDQTWLILVRHGNNYSIWGTLFSTQENLWLLIAFEYMLEAQPAAALGPAQPPPDSFSKNSASAAWTGRNLANPLSLTAFNKVPVSFLMQADFRLPELDTPRVDRGIRVERRVRNLTDAKRTGAPDSPLRIGDELLVTYRIFSERQQYFVALEDSLPAAFETVNPDIAQIGKFFEIPPIDPGDQLLDLSNSELRDRSTLLYFDNVAPGPGVYTILVRVTAAGTFRWPATQVTPMYDNRYSGLSASGVCVVSGE